MNEATKQKDTGFTIAGEGMKRFKSAMTLKPMSNGEISEDVMKIALKFGAGQEINWNEIAWPENVEAGVLVRVKKDIYQSSKIRMLYDMGRSFGKTRTCRKLNKYDNVYQLKLGNTVYTIFI